MKTPTEVKKIEVLLEHNTNIKKIINSSKINAHRERNKNNLLPLLYAEA